MDSIWSLLALALIFMAYPSSLASPYEFKLQTSAISAAPAFLPDPPLSSSSPLPGLSPDVTPLFPSPTGGVPSPSESSLPTIPSNPSPPNPDKTVAPGPGMAISPTGSMPAPFSVSPYLSIPLNLALFLGLLAFWLMQISGM